MRLPNFKTFQHFRANIQSHMYAQGSAHAQEIAKKAMISDPWLTLRLCAIRKCTKAELTMYLAPVS